MKDIGRSWAILDKLREEFQQYLEEFQQYLGVPLKLAGRLRYKESLLNDYSSTGPYSIDHVWSGKCSKEQNGKLNLVLKNLDRKIAKIKLLEEQAEDSDFFASQKYFFLRTMYTLLLIKIRSLLSSTSNAGASFKNSRFVYAFGGLASEETSLFLLIVNCLTSSDDHAKTGLCPLACNNVTL